MSRSLVEVQALKEELTNLEYKDLKARLVELGVAHVWKGGVKKSALVQSALQALEEKDNEVANTKVPAVEDSKDDESQDDESEEEDEIEEEEDEAPVLPKGELKVTEGLLDLFPGLSASGFNVGDTIVNDGENPIYKKENEESFEDSEDGTKGIVSNLSPEEADKIIKDLNGGKEYSENLNDGESEEEDEDNNEEDEIDSFEKTVAQDTKQHIDESKFTLEEIQENIDITEGLIKQSIPSTRIILLHKLEALQGAKERKESSK
jgi:hypothetical protein